VSEWIVYGTIKHTFHEFKVHIHYAYNGEGVACTLQQKVICVNL